MEMPIFSAVIFLSMKNPIPGVRIFVTINNNICGGKGKPWQALS
jgi:hypothetical protein